MTTPLVLDLPDDPAELAPWLDRKLVGLGLGRLVAELEVVHAGQAGGPAPALNAVLAGRLPAVLDTGLSALSRPALRELLRHPRLLLDLQERVLVDGGPYWAGLGADDVEVARAVAAGWPGVRTGLRAPAAPEPKGSSTLPFVPAPSASPPPYYPPRDRLLRAWAVLATMAASALVLLYTVEHLNPPVPETTALPANPFAGRVDWGWNRPGVLVGTGPPSAYLTLLADAASEWFDERPSTPGDLALRLGELRTGCTRLIVAGHECLQPADRAWLVDRCRDWAGKLDNAVHALERDDPVELVRSEVDATVNRLIAVLRDRAKAA
jgi:hypothetical protein